MVEVCVDGEAYLKRLYEIQDEYTKKVTKDAPAAPLTSTTVVSTSSSKGQAVSRVVEYESGVECSGIKEDSNIKEYSGVEGSDIKEYSSVENSGTCYSGVEYSGSEYSGVEESGINKFGVEDSGIKKELGKSVISGPSVGDSDSTPLSLLDIAEMLRLGFERLDTIESKLDRLESKVEGMSRPLSMRQDTRGQVEGKIRKSSQGLDAQPDKLAKWLTEDGGVCPSRRLICAPGRPITGIGPAR
jgi:hypothetical protein